MTSSLFVVLLLSATPEVLPATPVGASPTQAITDKLTQLVRSAVQAKSAGPTSPAPGAVLAEEARAKYFDLDFEGAAKLARESVTRSLEHPEEFGDGSGYVLAHVLEALARRELKDEAGAVAAFRAALAVKPDLSLSENDYSPDAIAALARAREDLARAPAAAEISVSSAPPFARVFVDGRFQGETPMTVKGIPPGRHLLELVRDGRLPHREWFDAGKSPLTVQPQLKEDPAATLRASLTSAVARGAKPDESVPAAAALAKELQRDVVVLALGARAGRVTLVAARVGPGGEVRRVMTSVDEDLLEASATAKLLSAALLEAANAEVAAVGTPGEGKFDEAWLGLMPPPAPVAPPPPPAAVTSKPLFWLLLGAGVIAAGAGTAYGVSRAVAPRSLGTTVEFPQ